MKKGSYNPYYVGAVQAARQLAPIAKYAYKNRGAIRSVVAEAKRQIYGRLPKSLSRQPAARRRPVRRVYASKPKYNLAKQVKNLQQKARAGLGTLVYRERDTYGQLAALGAASYGNYAINTLGQMENPLAQLRYYDPSNPGTLLTASGLTASFMKKFLFKSIYGKITCRNNYQSECVVDIYLCQSKDDTSIAPDTAITNGLTDTGAPTATSVLIWPSDSPQFLELWKVIKHKKYRVMPGRTCSMSHGIANIVYDPSLTDSHTMSYQRRYKAFSYLVRLSGTLGHDTVTVDEQNNLAAGLDVERLVVNKIEYDSGADIRYTYIVDNGNATFTTAGVQSSKPVSDNIGYSVG